MDRYSWKPAALGKFELAIYFAVWIAHSLYSIYASARITKQMRVTGNELYWKMVTIDRSPLPLIKGMQVDGNDLEWSMFLTYMIKEYCLALVIHSLCFNILKQITKNKYQFKIFMTIIDVFIHIYMFGLLPIVGCLIALIVTTLIVRLTKRTIFIWALTVIMLVDIYNLMPSYDYYIWSKLASLLYPYKAIQAISYSSYYVERKDHKAEIVDDLLEIVNYAFYLPYSSLLIVLFEDYEKQLDESFQNEKQKPYFSIMFFAIRLTFWSYFIEIFNHYCHVQTLFAHTSFVQMMTLAESASIAYLQGQIFNVKYFVMFGIGALFARLDDMSPEPPPQCISRTALYSKIWRRFDRGLYQFIKKRVYVPFIAPTYSIWRKIMGLCLSYSFVIAWHGKESKYLIWVFLNGFELVFEQVAVLLYFDCGLKQKIDAKISDANFRRLLAFLQNATTALGIFGVFHFLSAEGVGLTFTYEVLWNHFLHWKLFYIFILGYCYNNCCMELEHRLNPPTKRNVGSKKSN